jgi:hypothetical protein
MSFSTISRSTYDSALRERIIAATSQEAWNNPVAYDTQFGHMVRALQENGNAMVWAVCTATDIEAAYAYALNSANPNPGGDEGVITDAMILSAVQERWPQDPVPPAPPEPPPVIDNELPPE